MLLSIDLQKAFDSVSWPFMFKVMNHWGFGAKFLGILSALYYSPEAKVRFQGIFSESIEIRRGTRQGCPLSPLIFAIVIESLAIAIRENANIRGVRCAKKEHKCALFADDLLLFLTAPETSLPEVYSLMDEFSLVSGLAVNIAKSRALNVSLTESTVSLLKERYRFKWDASYIKYLGINLTPNIQNLYLANYPPMYRKLEKDLKDWGTQNIGWIGRINSVKMTLLPRLLYLFRSLPIPIIKSQLKSFQGKITKFIWNNKGPRLPSRTLYNLSEQGGLGVPNLIWYYQSARLAQLSEIFLKNERPDWIDIEEQAIPNITIEDLMWSHTKKRPSILSPTLSQTLVLWDSLKNNPSLISKGRPLSNIFIDPFFTSKIDKDSFKWWHDKGLYRIGRFFSRSGPLPEQHFIDKLDLPVSEKLRFSQLHDYAQSLWDNDSISGLLTPYESKCDQGLSRKGNISIIYNSLATNDTKLPHMLAWEKELNNEWDLSDWYKNYTRSIKGYVNVSLIEANIKMYTRWYLVPVKLTSMYPTTSPLCFRGCHGLGSMIHIWWECPKIRGYWNKVFNIIRRVTGCNLHQSPTIALLNGMLPLTSKVTRKLILYIMTGARITLAAAWKKTNVSILYMKRKVTWIMEQEKRVCSMLDKSTLFYEIWEPWLEYMGITYTP